VDGIVDVSGRVVGHLGVHAGGEFLLDLLQFHTHALDHVDRVCIWQNPNAHEDSLLAGEAHFRVVIFRAENDVGDISQPNKCAFVLADDELFELVRGVQIGVRSQIHLEQRTLRAADGRQIIIPSQCAANVSRADVQCGHPVGFHPNAHGKCASAKNIRFLHAADGGETRLHEPNEIIGHFIRLKDVGGKAKIS